MQAKKRCWRCNVSKPLLAFDKTPRARDGRRGVCRRCRDEARGSQPPEAPLVFQRDLKPTKRFLITAAQNATPVHAPFWKALQVAAKTLDAEIVVIPLRYKNPTSLWSKNMERDDWWDTDVRRYLLNQRVRLNRHLFVAADVKTQPTASSPLSGFESLTGAESCIIGHPKMQFRSVPVPSGRFPKILTTTGVCTVPNYTDTRAGKLGEFHHYLGGLIVEIDGDTFHLRQLNADRETGAFIDAETLYTTEGARPAPPALGLVAGDIHRDAIDVDVEKATFGPGGIVDVLKPRTLVVNDGWDGYSVNPHHRGNPFIAQAKFKQGLGNVRGEIERCVEFLDEKAARGLDVVLVASNHTEFLERWLINTDWRQDPGNAEFYLETAQAMVRSAQISWGGAEYDDPFTYWVRKLSKYSGQVRCLGPNDSFKLGENECGMHGHRGPNGARGTLKNLSRLGTRAITGHSHSPGIEEGHYQVGTSTPRRLEYNHGPSSWLNTHCIVYANGKRALINVIDGKWRLP
jgi:hypothetical protein